MWSKKNAVGKEEVAKLVDDIYRKMQDSGATDLASTARVVLDNKNNAKHKEEIEGTYQLEKVRCPCGSSLQADSSIQCEDTRCNVWQHIACVIIPEKPMEGILPEPPTKFYCELCRLGRADPFWVTVAHPLFPVKLIIANPPTDGTNPMLTVEKTFQLSRVDRVLLVKPEYDVQAWCMLLNDKVSFRMQWPQYAELQINGVPMRAINRPGSQLLGANGRDDGPIITPCTRDGINKISLTGCDSRVFCFGVRIVKRCTVQQILNIIPKESDGERFEDALARVCRCVGGGAATENADSDSDLEVVTDNISVNLRCPMSGLRMKIAGRFKPCAHMGCFDLEVFVEMNQRSRKWQCPICLKNYALENVIIDPYFTRITSKMLTCGEDVTDIEVKPDGSWRAKSKDDRKSLGDLGQWHLPDGTLFVPMEVESKPKPQSLKQVKQEGGSEGHTGLKLGMKKNKNGIWEVRKPENLHSHSSGSKLPENLIINGHKSISMSSSATGSGREADDISVNQNCGGNAIGQFDYSTPNDTEDLAVSAGDAEVIVLSDSEDEAANLPSSGQIYENNYQNGERVLFSSIPLGNPDPHHEDPSLMAEGSSCLDDDFGVPFWSLPSGNHSGPNFQLFGSDADPTDALVGCSTSMAVNGYSLAAETSMLGSSHTQSMNADINDGLIDYISPLGFGNDDPSLQLFLPTRSPEATEHVELTSRSVISNGFRSDDWISLRLGDGGCGGNCEPDAADAPAANGFNSRHQPPFKDGALNSLADTGPLHMGEVCPSFTEFSEAGERPANLSRMGDLPQKASDPLPTAVGTSTADVGVPPLVTPLMTSSAPCSSAQVPAAPTTVGVTDPGVSEIIYVPRWSVSEKHTTQSGSVCRELLDHFRPPHEVSRWRDLADEALENRLNILLAQVAVAGTEVRTRWVEQSNDLSSLAEKYVRKAKSVKKKKAECSKLSERLRTAEEEFSHFRTKSDSRSSALALRITELEKINSELVASNLALKEKANLPNLPPGHVTVPQTELNTLQSSIRRLNADLDATRGLLSSKENVLYAERASNAAAIQSLNETNKSLSDQKNVAVEEKHWVLREGVKTFTSRLFDSHEFFEPLGKLCESARLAGFSEGVVSGHRAARLRMPITSVSQYDAAASGKKYDDALSVFSHVQFPYIHTIAAASSLPLEEIKGLMPEAPAED